MPEYKRSPKHQHRCPTCGQRTGLVLTPDDVRVIKQLLREGVSYSKLAKLHGVTESTIARIKRDLI